ncbi:pilus assembly protein PilM [Mycoplasmatota bacterium]|nr:pilus assembly protein PilM [Mycoplasmatota bacterium]
MLFFRKNMINLMFTDNYIKFALVDERSLTVRKIGEYKLKNGIIVAGKIMDEALLVKILGTIFRKYRLTSPFVKLMVPDHNLIIKKMNVPKYLKGDDLKNYLRLELEESLQSLPFKDPIIDVVDYKLGKKNEEEKEVVMFTTSKEIMLSYLKVVQRHKKNVVDSYISPLMIRKLYLFGKKLKNNDQKCTMFTQIRENTHILTVFDNEIPILSLRDTFEIEDYNEEFYVDQILDVLERICHFYQYQFSKNKESVQKIVIYTDISFTQNLQELINEKMDIEVELIKGLPVKTSINQDLIRYYLPISMSL